MHPARALLAAMALLAAPSLASAAIPTGSFEIQFGGKQSIWAGEEGVDPGEEFCEGFEEGFDVLESCDFDLFVDGKGKLYGYFGFSGWSGGLHFAEGGLIKGTQRGDDRSGIARISLRIKLKGTASDGVETLPTRSSIRLSGQTTSEGLVSGVWNTRVCIQGVGCNEEQSSVPPAIESDGEWSLALAITDGGDDTLGGSARVEFGNGEDCLYSVSGKYNPNKDTAKLRLYPTESECEGTSLRLKDVRLFTGPTDEIAGSIAYRLFGFRGDTIFPDLAALSQRALENRYRNSEIFGFVCSGTEIITASTDPSTCGWVASSTREELIERQWALAEELALIPRDGSLSLPVLPSFGRRGFIYQEREVSYNGSASVGILSGASATIIAIPAYDPLEVRERLEELAP